MNVFRYLTIALLAGSVTISLIEPALAGNPITLPALPSGGAFGLIVTGIVGAIALSRLRK